ncbi:hypothetical protein BMF94_4720 [Rhodotorula taiwanensis]|uniref:mRNA-capping enzyme subunit beta n=1 Tax=Rhodotorula taiwanensis TaxID=741276 RepID=A0A2S5B603_9BASI|nr:hypothetical protein BMF94_4720 [Rhodotorula taiwanensis]
MAASPAPTNGDAAAAGGGGARQPSRSPSIVSILNNPDEAVRPYSDQDYFGTTGESFFTRTTSPTPATATAAAAAASEPPPRPSHKRPRTAGSGTHSPGTAVPLAGRDDAAHEEHEGSMEPPTSRFRRSSSTASAAAAAATTATTSSSAAGPPSAAPEAGSSWAGTASPGSTPSVSPANASPALASIPVPPPPPAPTHGAAATPTPTARVRRPAEADLPLEPSVFNVGPIDEFTREVADWLWGFTQTLDWDKVEVSFLSSGAISRLRQHLLPSRPRIEAKIGVLLDMRAGNQRVQFPVPIETILMDDTGLRFDANMAEAEASLSPETFDEAVADVRHHIWRYAQSQHAHFNQLLNMRVEEAAQPSYPHARIRYTHTRELDTFHSVPAPAGGTRKVRVTRDQKDPTKVKAVEKVRVADMNIFSPKRLFDWRISVSLEVPTPVPDTPPSGRSRYKDRISYSHQLCQVDLTKVQSGSPTAPATHELEVEIRNAKQLLEEAAKDQRGEENRYLDMVQILLNNIRMLIRNASEPQ